MFAHFSCLLSLLYINTDTVLTAVGAVKTGSDVIDDVAVEPRGGG